MLERTWQEQISESRSELSSETFNLAVPRSRCPTCSAQLSAIENVPVLSYLALRGRCRHCKSAIPRRYPLVELGASLISVLIVMTFGYTLSALAYLIFAWCLLTLSLIDLNHYLLPDDITLPLLWLGLLVSATGLGLPEVSLSDSALGAFDPLSSAKECAIGANRASTPPAVANCKPCCGWTARADNIL